MKNKAAPYHLLFVLFSLALFGAFPAISLAAPRVFYSDITSGPNTGGEGNQGAFVTIVGTGFGATRGSSVVQIADTDVATYKVWSDTKISFQPGSSVPSGLGAIRVTVAGESSNTDVTFNVRPGDIYFVSLSGNDSTCIPNNISSPCRNAQNVFNRADFGPGDHIVLRGGTWTDTNARYGSFFSLQDGKGGTAADPMVLMAYPGERVYVRRSGSGQKGIHAYNSPGGLTVAGLVIDMTGLSGTPFGFPPGAAANFGRTMQNIRAVNNELTGMISPGGGSAAMEGRGHHMKYIGNYIHHNGIPAAVAAGTATCPAAPGTCSSKLYHSIYFDNNDRTGTDDVEIAYNVIEHQGGGRGIQIYNSNAECTGGGASGAGGTITNVSVHHNVIHDIALDGIIFADCNYTGMVAYDNIVYRTAIPAYQTDGAGGGCIRFNNAQLVARVYNNTFYDCGVDGGEDSAGVRFQSSADIDFFNNIVHTSGGEGYTSGTPVGQIRTATNNLFFGSGAAPSWSPNSISADPLFLGASTGNFLLNSSSLAIDAGSALAGPLNTDIHGRPRPQGAYDIGAVETDGIILPSPTNVRITKR